MRALWLPLASFALVGLGYLVHVWLRERYPRWEGGAGPWLGVAGVVVAFGTYLGLGHLAVRLGPGSVRAAALVAAPAGGAARLLVLDEVADPRGLRAAPVPFARLTVIDPPDGRLLSRRLLGRNVKWLVSAPGELWLSRGRGLELRDALTGRRLATARSLGRRRPPSLPPGHPSLGAPPSLPPGGRLRLPAGDELRRKPGDTLALVYVDVLGLPRWSLGVPELGSDSRYVAAALRARSRLLLIIGPPDVVLGVEVATGRVRWRRRF